MKKIQQYTFQQLRSNGISTSFILHDLNQLFQDQKFKMLFSHKQPQLA